MLTVVAPRDAPVNESEIHTSWYKYRLIYSCQSIAVYQRLLKTFFLFSLRSSLLSWLRFLSHNQSWMVADALCKRQQKGRRSALPIRSSLTPGWIFHLTLLLLYWHWPSHGRFTDMIDRVANAAVPRKRIGRISTALQVDSPTLSRGAPGKCICTK